jgi:hypothetical protein
VLTYHGVPLSLVGIEVEYPIVECFVLHFLLLLRRAIIIRASSWS